MTPTSRKITTAAATIVSSFLLASAASAGLVQSSGLGTTASEAGLGSSRNLQSIIGSIIGGLITLLGSVFVVLIVYAGFIWMTAQGNEEKVKKAKGIITSAVIGLLVVFGSYVIAKTVISSIETATTGGGT